MTAEPVDSDDVYIAALRADEIFADTTYQRVLDVPRARKMASTWDRRLAGILEVSDRGEDVSPRYAVLDGQHRWSAAKFLQTPPSLVANVHSGLSLADEAALFDRLNRQRKQISTWDHWKARRAASDEHVLAIEAIISKHGLKVDPAPRDGHVGCTGTLEKVAKLDIALLDQALGLITGVWRDRRDGLDAAIIHGLALIFHYLPDIDLERLGDALLDVLPRQIKTQATALREMQPGTLPVITAVVIVGLYNKKPGRRIDVSNKTFGGSGVYNARPKARTEATPRQASGGEARATTSVTPLTQVGSPRDNAINVPSGLPPEHPETDAHAEAVEQMADRTDAEIAQALGITERAVRRIRADLGLERV